MPKRGKKYIEARKKVDRSRDYSPSEAIRLVKETSYANFDETVELHIRTNLDPRKADQQLRGVVVLPNGTGKPVRVLVFATGEAARLAEEAGADYVGADDLVKRIQQGWTDFDVAIATPDMMPLVGRLGRILGPRGLMPSPKTGTVVPAEDLPRVIREARQGRVEYRLDKSANLHVPIGKVSFSDEALLENMAAMIEAIQANRPSGAKGQMFRRIALASTMGPGVRVSVPEALQLRTS
ncbi:MAG: 50S ribosomal protein L1 [Ardenticatenia bacterium]|nr:50S ribosomal protein L1 [Ardenticatenia bacterium]